MNRLSLLSAAVLACAIPFAYAQKPPVSQETVTASTPGKAAAASAVEMKATITGLDKATRTLTVKGPKGRVVDVVAGDDVRNFDQVKVGDQVVLRYIEALTLELRKTRSTPSRDEQGAVARTAPGERPGAAAARQVTVLADVVAVDPEKKTISLKGPRGNVVTLDVKNPDHFKVVKKGDQVEAVYTEAIALAVTPAPAAKSGKR